MKQIELIPEIQRLCIAGHYDEAIKLTNQIEDEAIAIKAHLLCVEHEERRRLDNQVEDKRTLEAA